MSRIDATERHGTQADLDVIFRVIEVRYERGVYLPQQDF
jgi:hypothetical protein